MSVRGAVGLICLALWGLVASTSIAHAQACSAADIADINALLDDSPSADGLDTLRINFARRNGIWCAPVGGNGRVTARNTLEIGHCTTRRNQDLCFVHEKFNRLTALTINGPGISGTPADDVAYDLPAGVYTVSATARGETVTFSFEIIEISPNNQRIRAGVIPIYVNGLSSSFAVEKTLTSGPNSLVAPATLTWGVTVQNTGNVALTAPVVTDLVTQDGSTIATLLPTLVGGDGGTAGTLDPSETWTYTASYAVSQADIDAGDDIVNTFTFDPSNPTYADPENDNDTVAVTATPNLELVKTATLQGGGPIPVGGVSAGDVIDYTYRMTNLGNVTLLSIAVNDVHGGTGALGTIGGCSVTADNGAANDTVINGAGTVVTGFAPLDEVTCSATYTVVQSDIDQLQ